MSEPKQTRLLRDGEKYQLGNSLMYGKQLLDQLHGQMQAQSDYCDVTVRCCDTDMKAHWCVLAAAPYFQSLYNSGLQEKQQDRVHIGVGSVEAVRTVLTYLYTGSVSLDSSTFEEVLEVADYLQVDGIKKLCTDVLRYHVATNVDNCVHKYVISDLYNLDSKSTLLAYIKEHLDTVIVGKSGLEMTPGLIHVLMEDPILSYVSREDFFKFLVSWVKDDPDGRKEHFYDLFSSLNLHKMNLDFLKIDVQSSDLIASSDVCLAKCKTAINKFSSGELCSDGKTDVIIVLGGLTEDFRHHRQVFGYVVCENRWFQLPNMPAKYEYAGMAFNPAKNCLYVCDQEDGNELCKFDFTKQIWTKDTLKLPPTKVSSKSINLCVDFMLVMEKGHKLYMVANGIPQQGKSKVPDHNVYLLEANQEMTGYEKCSVVYRSHRTLDIIACVVRDRYICVMVLDRVGVHNTKVFVKDAGSKRGKQIEITKQESLKGTGTHLFAVHKKLYMIHTDDFKVFHSVYDVHLRKWSTVNSEKPIFPGLDNRNYGYAVCENRLYMFGGRKRVENNYKTPGVYSSVGDLVSGKIQNLAELPQALTNCSALHVRIPQEFGRCHINCPHCKAVRQNDTYSETSCDEESEEDYCEEFNCNCGMCRPYYNSSSDEGECSIM